MRIVVRGNWANYVGTDYCEALGIYNSLEDAMGDAEDYAWSTFEEDEDDYEDGGYIGEGPDFWVEEYNPEKHDGLKVGAGSFERDFAEMEKRNVV